MAMSAYAVITTTTSSVTSKLIPSWTCGTIVKRGNSDPRSAQKGLCLCVAAVADSWDTEWQTSLILAPFWVYS